MNMNVELQNLLSSASQLLHAFKFSEAKQTYQQALSLAPGNGMAMLGLAMVYNRTNEADKAKQMLLPLLANLTAAQKQQQPVVNAKRRGKQRQPQPAVKEAQVDHSGSLATVYAQLGFACHQLNQLAEAKRYYEASMALFPSSDVQNLLDKVDKPLSKPSAEDIILEQVNRLVAENHLNDAIEVLKKALELAPESAKLLHGLGMLLRYLKQPDQALPLVQQAIILEPDNAVYYNDLGMIFEDRGEHQKAITFYKRALKLNPQYAIAYSNLGVTYKHLNQLDDAVAAYMKALELKPNMAAAHNNLGNLYRMMGKKTEAQVHLLKAIELVPDYADAKKNLSALFAEV